MNIILRKCQVFSQNSDPPRLPEQRNLHIYEQNFACKMWCMPRGQEFPREFKAFAICNPAESEVCSGIIRSFFWRRSKWNWQWYRIHPNSFESEIGSGWIRPDLTVLKVKLAVILDPPWPDSFENEIGGDIESILTWQLWKWNWKWYWIHPNLTALKVKLAVILDPP